MLEIRASNRFKRDLKLLSKRGLNLDLLEAVVQKIACQIQLEPKYQDHPLTGDYDGFRECHILPDWLLIYRIDDDGVYLFLSRSGSHSDLF
ncbi:MAG: type II toxin-antitoxin system YafQ family toxin [Oscillospiraceae bacterium]|nr:type II toxin-antitoxin system YafQ family toxin [Clostridia bacterium]MBO5640108.1 type II toxin-antitoxin system YafQ family toxin [Oscillospiraceae bacterium]